MTWDGIPEHRNLSGDGEPKIPFGKWSDFFGDGSRPPQLGAADTDPFAGLTDLSGLDEGAAATHEMFRSHVKAGFSEQQTLFYLACVMQVGVAIQKGGLLPPPDQEG